MSRWIGALWTTRPVVHTMASSVAPRAPHGDGVDMSFFFADPAELAAIAARISRHADAARAGASTLAAAISKDQWRGFASEVFAAQAASVTADLLACAARLEDAADALRRHAGRIEGLLGDLARLVHGAENVGETLLHDAGDFLFGGGTIVVEGILADVLARAGR